MKFILSSFMNVPEMETWPSITQQTLTGIKSYLWLRHTSPPFQLKIKYFPNEESKTIILSMDSLIIE